ncbi:hypothetical protein XccvBFoX3_gp71c [Xanthomonas phage FoX3]|uniref:Uncharacterized protein n=1 Tax=Xanthomonas phage FoX3 TaxID=2723899 RepID=A0A858NPM9_9CAUD|nr:hypothetical protein KNU95_gp71 [Xanthomonas phage FoX3]QJB21971.1 hypothetical protein XccvBFoX3_gp71c [Xanthomonas phage FoX3]
MAARVLAGVRITVSNAQHKPYLIPISRLFRFSMVVLPLSWDHPGNPAGLMEANCIPISPANSTAKRRYDIRNHKRTRTTAADRHREISVPPDEDRRRVHRGDSKGARKRGFLGMQLREDEPRARKEIP